MAASLVQWKFAQVVAGTTLTATLDSAPAKDNLLIAVLTANAAPTIGPVHPWGNAPDVAQSSGAYSGIYSKVAVASEPSAVTFSATTARNYALLVMEFSPSAGKGWGGPDQTAVATSGAATSIAVGPTAAQAAADDVAILGVGTAASYGGTTPTATNGYTVTGWSGTARGFGAYAILASGAATSTTASWTSSVAPGAAIATYKQAAVLAVRTGTATLKLNATATSVEVEKSPATAGLTLTATGAMRVVLPKTGAAAITLTATATVTTREILTRTGTATVKVVPTAIEFPPSGIYKRTGAATIKVVGSGPARTVHPRAGTAGITLGQTNVTRSYVVERRTAAAVVTLATAGHSTVIERRTSQARIVIAGRGHVARLRRDVTVISVVDRQRKVTITSVPRLVRIEPRP